MQYRPRQPVQAGDLQGVTLAQQLQDEIELRAGGLRAGGPVEMDVLQIDARADERVDLVIGGLVRGRYPVRSRRACVGIYFGDPFLPTTRR